jgi:hypothetical protein
MFPNRKALDSRERRSARGCQISPSALQEGAHPAGLSLGGQGPTDLDCSRVADGIGRLTPAASDTPRTLRRAMVSLDYRSWAPGASSASPTAGGPPMQTAVH